MQEKLNVDLAGEFQAQSIQDLTKSSQNHQSVIVYKCTTLF